MNSNGFSLSLKIEQIKHFKIRIFQYSVRSIRMTADTFFLFMFIRLCLPWNLYNQFQKNMEDIRSGLLLF